MLQRSRRESILQKLDKGIYRYEIVACPICSSNDFISFVSQDGFGIPVYPAVCKNCGLLVLNPRMDDASYDDFYRIDYRKLYLGKEKPDEVFFQKQVNRGASIYGFLEEKGFSIVDSNVLEVGCGAGGILQFFKERGNTIYGIGLDSDFLQYGITEYFLDLHSGRLKDADIKLPPGVVIYSHVLEHLLNPVDEIEALKKIIDVDTIIYIEVPGLLGIWNKWKMPLSEYFLSSHVNYFTAVSLSNLMGKCGIEILYIDDYIRCIARLSKDDKVLALKSDFSSTLLYLRKEMRLDPVNRLKSLARRFIVILLTNLRVDSKLSGSEDKPIYEED